MDIAKKIANILDCNKATDVEVLKVEGLTDLTQYLVIATGNSNPQIKALGGYVEEILEDEDDFRTHHSEGYSNTGWVLLDYGHVLVNIFDEETRAKYSLEKLWESAERIPFEAQVEKYTISIFRQRKEK